jgi:hypothetical protein
LLQNWRIPDMKPTVKSLAEFKLIFANIEISGDSSVALFEYRKPVLKKGELK